MHADLPASTSPTSRHTREPFIGRGTLITWTILIAAQIGLDVVRLRGWWASAPDVSRFEALAVLLLMPLPCVLVWRVHHRLTVGAPVRDPQTTDDSAALTRLMTTSLMTMLPWTIMITMLFGHLLGRAVGVP
jgi:hypothetical protein